MSALTLAAAGLRGHARRLGATAIAIILSVGFVATTMLMLDAMERGTAEAVAGDMVERDLVVWSGEQPLSFPQVDALRATEGLGSVQLQAEVWGSSDGMGALATTAPQGPAVELVEGRLPQGTGETAVPPESGLAVGSSVPFARYLDDGTSAPAEELEVVGVLDVGNSPRLTWQDVLVVDEVQLRTWDPELALAMVSLDLGGLDDGAARAAIDAIVPGAEVLTGQEAASRLVSMYTGGLDMLGPVLLGFGAVAAATSALVIANTFAIMLAQRTRELALLRCVGATRGQVRRTVLTEALLLGVVAATAGVLLAVGITWGASSVLGEVNLGSPVTLRPGWELVSLLVPWLVGVAMTLAAAWWPTRRATRVAPMVALHPVASPAVATRPGLVRVGVALLLLGAGGAGLVLAASSHDVLLGVAAGLLSFLGVLVATVFLVPAGIQALGSVLRGVPGRLAVGNTVSNPGRAAVTSAALLIGVTLITMTSVGAASAERTALAEIDAEYPADVLVFPMIEPASAEAEPAETARDGRASTRDDGSEQMVMRPLEPGVAAQVADLDGVAQLAQLTGGYVEVRNADDTWWTDLPVHGVNRDQVDPILRDAGLSDALEPGTIGLNSDHLEASGLEQGAVVTVSGPDGTAEARVVEFPMADAVMPAADLLELDAGSGDTGGLMLRLTDDADVGQVVTEVRNLVESDGAWVTGGAADRATLNTMLDMMVLITTGLLGVAVVIAIVGIANTLALSVLERSRENALLRALGLTRGQLRGMLTIEGVLLALVSAVLGLVLGVTYAWFGVRTLLPDVTDALLAFPVTQLGVILALAVVAGLLASVLPARRAARIAPAAGLAAV